MAAVNVGGKPTRGLVVGSITYRFGCGVLQETRGCYQNPQSELVDSVGADVRRDRNVFLR